MKICTSCGSLLSPRVVIPKKNERAGGGGGGGGVKSVSRFREHYAQCVVCDRFDCVKDVYLPYIFLHLVCQLASVNIKIRVETKSVMDQ